MYVEPLQEAPLEFCLHRRSPCLLGASIFKQICLLPEAPESPQPPAAPLLDFLPVLSGEDIGAEAAQSLPLAAPESEVGRRDAGVGGEEPCAAEDGPSTQRPGAAAGGPADRGSHDGPLPAQRKRQ